MSFAKVQDTKERNSARSTLSGKVCIVTGGSRGLGRELALQLADQRAMLVLAARNTEALQNVAIQCSKKGTKAIAVPTDIGNPLECQFLIEKAVAEYGQLDILLNNAGVRVAGRFDELRDTKLIDYTMRVNFLGAAYCTFYALPYLKRSSGRLVAVASLAGMWAVPARNLYSASKFAMRGFFDSLRLELEGEGISVTVAYPGFLSTETGSKLVGPDGSDASDALESKARKVPTERCARLVLKAAAGREAEVMISHVAKRRGLRRMFQSLIELGRGLTQEKR